MAGNGQNTNSTTPLEWEHVKSTINLLTLAVSQIECSMTDGEQSVGELTRSFTFIADQLSALIKDDAPSSNLDMTAKAEEIHHSIIQSIVAFQFYDRLSQRLDHVKRDLNWLSELVSNPEQANCPAAWTKLQEDIKSNYTMEDERIMFEHIMNGASVQEALEIYRHHFDPNTPSPDSDGDEVELF